VAGSASYLGWPELKAGLALEGDGRLHHDSQLTQLILRLHLHREHEKKGGSECAELLQLVWLCLVAYTVLFLRDGLHLMRIFQNAHHCWLDDRQHLTSQIQSHRTQRDGNCGSLGNSHY
jgi:hypothetical protein